MPKISVIIPVYNTEKYLKQCLDSVLNNTMKDIEIICVDDGSTDNSLKVLEEYKNQDKRIKIIKQEKNLGAGNSRNVGLEVATGEFLYFLDSDDFVDEKIFEKTYNQAKTTGADICVFGINKYSELVKEVIIDKAPNLPDNLPNLVTFDYHDIQDEIFYYFKNAVWNKIFRHDFIKNQNLKFQEIKRSNDLYFSKVALLSAKKITVLTDKLVFYRIHQKFNCQNNNYKCPYEFSKALLKLQDYINENNFNDAIKHNFKQQVIVEFEYNLNSVIDYIGVYIKLWAYIYFILCSKFGIDYRDIKRLPLSKLILNFIFSLRNSRNKKQEKIITILGFVIKIKRKVSI